MPEGYEKTKYQGVFTRTMKSGDRSYYITYYAGGKKVFEKVGKQSEKYTAELAYQIRIERIRERRHGRELDIRKKAPRFSTVADKYLAWAAKNKAREGYDDTNRYNKHLKDSIGKKRLDDLTPMVLEELKSDLYRKGLSDATVKHILVLVRMVWNKAVAWNLWKGENPIKKIKLPTVQNRRERYLSPEEAALILAKLKERSSTTHDIALLSLRCGLRFGEITSLRRMDIDLDNGIINVSDPKNKTSRKAFMTPAVREILQARLPEYPEEYVFTDRQGQKIRELSNAFDRVVEGLGWNAGITDRRQKVTFHTLRHTHASLLAIQGESLITIAEALGHKSLQMVKRYAHLSDTTRREAAEKLERTMAEAVPVIEESKEHKAGKARNGKKKPVKKSPRKTAAKK
ncbi:MAG: tyrosine-type recombinase/integrase [Syntrophorhabdus sp.]|nr:tyrosine-type recombinase/integrase [Syntrophorhabdus sp.]